MIEIPLIKSGYYKYLIILGLLLNFVGSLVLLDVYEIKKVSDSGLFSIRIGGQILYDDNGNVVEHYDGIEPSEVSPKLEVYRVGFFFLIAGFVIQLIGFILQEFFKKGFVVKF